MELERGGSRTRSEVKIARMSLEVERHREICVDVGNPQSKSWGPFFFAFVDLRDRFQLLFWDEMF